MAASAPLAEAADIFGRLTVADREAMLRLYESRRPWRIGNAAEFPDYNSRLRFYDLGLVTAVFPEAKPGDSGRQHWMLSALGDLVFGYALQWRDEQSFDRLRTSGGQD